MLSRTAENLFWMARVMERAENTARMLDVSFRMALLPSTLDKQALHFEPILAIAPGMDAEGVAGRLMQAIAEWSAGTEQFDDTTVVVVDVAA